MIVMTPDAGEREIAAVRARLETTGVHVLVMPGELTTAIGAIGDPEGVRELGLEGMPGVDRVVPISRPYKLASLEMTHDAPSRFEINGRRVGGNETFCLIAGPCTVETREQTLEVARVVKAGRRLDAARRRVQAAHVAVRVQGPRRRRRWRSSPRRARRPGCRSSPSSWTPPTPTRSPSTPTSSRSARATCRTTRCWRSPGKLGKPVLLKRGLRSSLDELLMAADYVLKEGNERVMLCERGIRTFETATRFTLDLSAVPWLKLHTHLPVIVDPSHASGDRRLVEPLARAAAAVGADGIIVEVHQDPAVALCDGPQALYGRDFAEFASRVAAHASLDGRGSPDAAGEVGEDERGDRQQRAEELDRARAVAARDLDREGHDRHEVHEQRAVGGADPAHALVPRQHADHGAGEDDVGGLPTRRRPRRRCSAAGTCRSA